MCMNYIFTLAVFLGLFQQAVKAPNCFHNQLTLQHPSRVAAEFSIALLHISKGDLLCCLGLMCLIAQTALNLFLCGDMIKRHICH